MNAFDVLGLVALGFLAGVLAAARRRPAPAPLPIVRRLDPYHRSRN